MKENLDHLSLNEMSNPRFRHDRDSHSINNLFDHLWVALKTTNMG